MTKTIWLPASSDKELFTAKTESGYVGCYSCDSFTAITPQSFEKPLEAANAARRMKKQINLPLEKVVKKNKTIKQLPKKQVKFTTKLYTQEEANTMPLLSFQEVWVITKDGEYVSDCLNVKQKRLVAYTKDKKKAKQFSDHEDAKRSMRTLKGVVGPGFGLLRFFKHID